MARDRDALRADVAARLKAPRWVVDGDYAHLTRDLVWTAADTVIWLDLPLHRTARRLLARTLRRGLTRRELWNGNTERPLQVLDPRPAHNIVLWSLTRHRGLGRRARAAMRDPRWVPLRPVRLCDDAAVAGLLDHARE